MRHLIGLLVLVALLVHSAPALGGDPIIGCCQRAGQCGNVHNGFEAGVCQGFMIQGVYIQGMVCPNPRAPCVAPTGNNPKDQDDSGKIEYACTGLPLIPEGGSLTCSLDDPAPSPDVLTIPAELGGGSLDFSEFEVAFDLAYQQADDGNYHFALESFRAQAPSVQLKGNTTGQNRVSLVEEGIGGGVWDIDTGEVHGSFTLAITNEIFSSDNPLYSFPSVQGNFDSATGRMTLQSRANVFWPADSAALLGSADPQSRWFFYAVVLAVIVFLAFLVHRQVKRIRDRQEP